MDQILRHVNGGAQKVGSEVHVSADSFCDAESIIAGESCVLHSSFRRALWWDSQAFNSKIEVADVTKSVCAGSEVRATMLHDCTLDNAVVIGHPTEHVYDRLILKDIVAENCELYGGWTLEGNARIPTGIWHRAPRFKRITGANGVDIGLTESTNGYALMACWRKPITKWLAYGPRLGQKHRWTAEQIEDARLFFQELLDVKLEGVIANAA